MANNPSNPRKSGSGFSNLQNYLQANQQNRLGSTIGAGVSSAANRASGNLAKATQEFQSGAERGQLATDANRQAREAVLGRIANTGTTTPAVTDQEANQFQTFRAGQYSGPKELSNQYNIAQQANQAEQMGKGLTTQAGRTGLLQQFVGGPQYTSGQQKLDNLLLGQSPDLSKARQSTVGLNSSVQRAGQQAAATAAQNQAQAQKFANETNAALEGQRQSIANPLEQQLTAQQAAQQAALARIQEGARTGQFTAGDINMLGLREGQNLYDMDISQNLNPVIAPTLGGLSTEQQRAQLQALSRLAGQDVSQFYQGFDPNAQQYDPSHAVSLRSNFQDALAQRGKEVEQAINSRPTDLSGSYKAWDIKSGSGVPEWMRDPNGLKNVSLTSADQMIKDAQALLDRQRNAPANGMVSFRPEYLQQFQAKLDEAKAAVNKSRADSLAASGGNRVTVRPKNVTVGGK